MHACFGQRSDPVRTSSALTGDWYGGIIVNLLGRSSVSFLCPSRLSLSLSFPLPFSFPFSLSLSSALQSIHSPLSWQLCPRGGLPAPTSLPPTDFFRPTYTHHHAGAHTQYLPGLSLPHRAGAVSRSRTGDQFYRCLSMRWTSNACMHPRTLPAVPCRCRACASLPLPFPSLPSETRCISQPTASSSSLLSFDYAPLRPWDGW